jgi:hypothetical protein
MSPPQVARMPIPHSAFQLAADEDELTDKLYRDMHRDDKLYALNPYKQALTVANVESCVVLEDHCFPPHERCSREKVS